MTLFSLLLRLQIVPRFTVFILNFKHKLTHVLAYNCSIVTCQNITRHMIWRQTFLSFHNPGMECFQKWVFTLLCNQPFPASLSLFRHWTGKLCHVRNVFQLVLLLFEEKWQEYYQQSHSQVQNEHVPFPMIHCRFVHCNYVQKLEKAGVLVVQVADAKVH